MRKAAPCSGGVESARAPARAGTGGSVLFRRWRSRAAGQWHSMSTINPPLDDPGDAVGRGRAAYDAEATPNLEDSGRRAASP